MSQHLAEGFYLKSHLNAPCCECMPQHVKMHILNVASLTVFFDVILQGTRLNYPDNVFDGDEYYNVLKSIATSVILILFRNQTPWLYVIFLIYKYKKQKKALHLTFKYVIITNV